MLAADEAFLEVILSAFVYYLVSHSILATCEICLRLSRESYNMINLCNRQILFIFRWETFMKRNLFSYESRTVKRTAKHKKALKGDWLF